MKIMLKLLRTRKSTQGEKRAFERDTCACPECGAVATFLVASTDRNRHTTSEVFDYFRCTGCHLVFMYPIPTDLRPFYAGGYGTVPKTLEDLAQIAQKNLHRMQPVLQFKQRGRLLEIGPWMGAFSYNARQAGFDVTAIEIDQSCVDFLNGAVGIHAIQSGDPAATLSAMDECFDVIALWHCLEHLPDPWTVVEQAALRLSHGGILLIAIPNIESYEFELLHADWQNLDTPRHLYFFPIDALTALCARFGLVRRLFTTSDQLSQEFSTGTWHQVATSMVPVRYVRGVLGRILRFFANRHERRNESGSSMTAVFQRPPADRPPV